MTAKPARLLVLSDTHGALPDAVRRACAGADHIVHAGDIGSESILPELEAMAPVTAVSGNVDPSDRAPGRGWLEIGGWRVLVQHVAWDRGEPSPEVREVLAREGADLVVFGHSHEPLCRRVGEAVFLNPGSCGPRRFSHPRAYAEALLALREGWFRIFALDGPRGGTPFVELRLERP